MSRQKVIHLIPYDGIGGVETAARSMLSLEFARVDFSIQYIRDAKGPRRFRLGFGSFRHLIAAANRILKLKPDLLIISLWRAGIVGIMVKLLCPKMKVVLFLHYPGDVHWADFIVTRVLAKVACQIWADSSETLARRLPVSTSKGRVISFVTMNILPLPHKDVRASFIFWGRIHPQKNLPRALRIFRCIHEKHQDARFFIIGPDGGDLERVKDLILEYGLKDSVTLFGPLQFSEVAKLAEAASFYLQTSLLEGMAMSVVEAMQLGLVPVVTPVGEVSNYAVHNFNALIVSDDDRVIDDVLAILNDKDGYNKVAENAVNTWRKTPLYAASVVAACEDILCDMTISGNDYE